MTFPFILPSPHGSHLVAMNPNIDTLNSVPLADGSPDLFFVVFGQGSAMDLNALLVYAQESLDISIVDGHRAWIFMHSDGAIVVILKRHFSIAQYVRHGLGLESYSTSLDGRVIVNDAQLSHISVSESKVPFLPPCSRFLFISDQYTFVNTLNLLAVCGLRSLLTLERGNIVLHVVERPSFNFTTLSSKPGPHFGVPTAQEFCEMWKAWDLVTLGMIPSHLLHVKPIDLRHKCLFYLGHIPT